MSDNKGPWGGGGSDDDDRPRQNGGKRPGQGEPNVPDIDEIVRKGQAQLRVLMGGRNGKNRKGSGGNGGGGTESDGFQHKAFMILALIAFLVFAAFKSFYTVRPEEKSVEFFLGQFSSIGTQGLNFAPWPLVTYEVLAVTREQAEDVGVGAAGGDAGLMLTGDENIVDIDFQVVWNISDPAKFLFNLRDPKQTIRAVSESAMREIIAQSQLSPILNRDRGAIAGRLQDLIQLTLDSYDSGVNIVRVNFDKADPPREVIDAFRAVQDAEQERDRLEKQADAYSNQVVAAARGQAAQTLEEAEGYRARVVNEAQGEASRFTSVLAEYAKAPDVTRKRLYLEMMEDVLGSMDKIILDQGEGGSGVVPYLPLNELQRKSTTTP